MNTPLSPFLCVHPPQQKRKNQKALNETTPKFLRRRSAKGFFYQDPPSLGRNPSLLPFLSFSLPLSLTIVLSMFFGACNAERKPLRTNQKTEGNVGKEVVGDKSGAKPRLGSSLENRTFHSTLTPKISKKKETKKWKTLTTKIGRAHV